MRIPNKIPAKLGIRGGDEPLFTGGAAAFNYAFAGLPFLSAASNIDAPTRRIKRQTAPFRKGQVDQQVNPGEQSFDGFWLRSQMTFHGGAGLLYSDPSSSSVPNDTRFWRSYNIDPWEQGKIKLLHETVAKGKASVLELFSITTTDGTGCIVGIQSAAVFFIDDAGTVHNKTAPGAGTLRSVTSNGNAIFISATDGIWKATMPAAPGDALTWSQIYTVPGGGANRQELAWVKERLVLGINRDLYELESSPAGPPAVLPAPFYTANPTGWTWTSISETSPAIYAAGSVNGVGSILKFTLDNTGGLPTLTGGTVAATLPGGEVPYAVYGYLGDFLGIGTSKGARIARSDDQGFLTYGPLLFESSESVVDWIGSDRFLWCTYTETEENTIKLARVDLSNEIETLRFAYATDLVTAGDTSRSTCVTIFGGTNRLAIATVNDTYWEDKEHYAPPGYLITSRIRYSTLESKIFRSIRVRGPQLEGTLGISVINEGGTETPMYTYGVGQTPGLEDIKIPGNDKHDFLSFKFTLDNSEDETGSAELYGWQVKALPANPRQRLITLPVWCFDFEKDRHGQRVGGHGRALTRLLALENVEQSGIVIQWQDMDADTAQDIFIENLEFEQSDPPPHFKGWGGIIRITFRTV